MPVLSNGTTITVTAPAGSTQTLTVARGLSPAQIASAIADSGSVIGTALDARFIQPSATHTDGRLLAWSASLGEYTEVAATGARLIASATNVTSTVTSATTTGGLGTAVAVPGTVISVTDSAGLPVLISWSAYWAQTTTTGDGRALLALYETTSGAVQRRAGYDRLPNSITAPFSYFDSPIRAHDIGVVTTTRTFQLYVQLWTAAGVSATAALFNSTAAPTIIRAATGV